MITLLTSPCTHKGQPASRQIGYYFSDPGEGLPELIILTDWKPTLELFSDIASYHVEEILSGMDGHAFLLHRSPVAIQMDALEGIDADTYYGVFISRNGQDDTCECKGCQAQGLCKHIAVMRQLVEGGHLSGLAPDPDPDPRLDRDQVEPPSPEAPF